LRPPSIIPWYVNAGKDPGLSLRDVNIFATATYLSDLEMVNAYFVAN